MNGVYISGMKMPKSCSVCWALDDYGDYPRCRITQEQRGYNFPVREQRMGNCPFIPVPEHGDLIDRDAFLAEQRHLYCENCERRKGMKNGKMKFVYDIGDAPCRACGYGDVLDDLEDAPTIIQADPPVMYYPQVPGITPTVIAEEVYDEYTDTAGNHHWKGALSGEHIIPADKEGEG